MSHPPASISNAVAMIWGLIGLYALQVVASVLTTAPTGEAGTGPVLLGAIVSLVVFGGLYLLLAHFLRAGAGWARVVLTVLAALSLLGALANVLAGAPALVILVGTAQAALSAALLWFLWRPDSSAHLRRTAGGG